MRRILLSVLFLVNLGWLSPATAASQVLRMHHDMPADSALHKGVMVFKQLVEARSQGQYRVEVFAANSLGDDLEVVQQLQIGAVQAAPIPLAKLSNLAPALQMLDLPFLFDDLEAVKRFQRREKSRELLRSMAGQNIYGLAFWNNGMKQLSATRELRAPVDAKGLAFRIQSSSVLEAQFAALGAQAKRIPFGESLKALQAGTVQGTENAWSNMAAAGFDRAQPFITETNHGSLNYMLISSSSFWQSIPYATRSELEAIVEEVTAQVNEDAEALNRRGREQLLAAGQARLLSLSPAEREAWRSVMQPLWKQYEAEIGADVLRAAQTVNRR